jgi:hypothetical protein
MGDGIIRGKWKDRCECKHNSDRSDVVGQERMVNGEFIQWMDSIKWIYIECGMVGGGI